MSVEKIRPDELAKRPRGRPSLYVPEFCELVKVCGADGDSITAMAVACGVHVDTIYEWAEVHQDFSDALEMARQLSRQWWEDRLKCQADGTENGSTQATQFAMKNQHPYHYREKHELGIIGGDGPPVQVDQEWKITVVDCDDKS